MPIYFLNSRQRKWLRGGKELRLAFPHPPETIRDYRDWVDDHLDAGGPKHVRHAQSQLLTVVPRASAAGIGKILGAIRHAETYSPWTIAVACVLADVSLRAHPRSRLPTDWPGSVQLDDGSVLPASDLASKMAEMTTKDLREKYGNRNTRGAINAAIRAEIPGGNEVLDGLDRLNKLVRNARSPEAGEGLAILLAIRDAMEADIRRRYGIPVNQT